MELTPEEMQIINKHRAEKQRQEQEALAQKQAEDDAQQEELEEQFTQALKNAAKEVKQHVQAADAHLQQAVKIAEKYGVPIEVDLICMPKEREYFPDSFTEKWSSLSEDTLENLEIYDQDAGWEYWSASSLTC
jgi:hypothetical protein